MSFTAGITGPIITTVGMPAADSTRRASSRLAGVEARGSIARANFPSSVVTEMATFTSPRSAMDVRISRSRNTSADLVTMPTG